MATRTQTTIRFRSAFDAEYPSVLRLVDRAFHAGGTERLRQTFPTALDRKNISHLYVGELQGKVVCAAAAILRDWITTGGVLRTACLGSFATLPELMGRGLSSALQGFCLERARAEGAVWAVLFSDRPYLYAGRGFRPADVERYCGLDSSAWPPPPPQAQLRPARQDDAAALMALYERHPLRAVRPLADLQAHLDAASSRVEVLELEGRVRAYAAVGKGADFGNVVCEYAGAVPLVHALWGRAAAVGARTALIPRGAEAYLTGRAANVRMQSRPAALACVLDAARFPGELAELGFAVWGFDSA